MHSKVISNWNGFLKWLGLSRTTTLQTWTWADREKDTYFWAPPPPKKQMKSKKKGTLAMATSGPPPLRGASSESWILFTLDLRWSNYVTEKVQLHMWSLGTWASSKILEACLWLIFVMKLFAHQVKVLVHFVITFVTLRGKCQWFCRCALPLDASGSSHDISWTKEKFPMSWLQGGQGRTLGMESCRCCRWGRCCHQASGYQIPECQISNIPIRFIDKSRSGNQIPDSGVLNPSPISW